MIYRKSRYWKLVLIAAVILVAFIVASFAWRVRSTDLERLIYAQCVANEQQDVIIVADLQARKRQVRATLPPNSAELYFQLQVLNDGIAALEPPGEPDCVPPKGVDP